MRYTPHNLSDLYFSFHSECLFQRRRRDPTSRQRKVYCILCLLSYCFFCSKFQQLEACTYISNAPTPFLHRDGPECVASFFVHSMCISTPPTRSYIATAFAYYFSSLSRFFLLAKRSSVPTRCLHRDSARRSASFVFFRIIFDVNLASRQRDVCCILFYSS